MNKSIQLLSLYLFLSVHPESYSQNLQSLLLNRNINSTFSILAFDKGKKEWGMAVATNNICVGNSTIYIEPGIGAFSVIAETEPAYAINGFKQLKKGRTIEQAILYTKSTDAEFYNRQVSGIDSKGNVYAFTGNALKYWVGVSAHKSGKGYVVMGNQLADSVLNSMSSAYETSTGTLANRLLKSLVAGQIAGGQITGKQSAALMVKGSKNEWFNQIDLRVDNSTTPFEDLQKLLNYHYGRILLNQSIAAIKMKNRKRGEELLHQAELLVGGWSGISGKLVMAYILLENEDRAVSIIQNAIAEKPGWKENLPAFYCLSHRLEVRQLLNINSFSLKDWGIAINFMTEINQYKQSIDLAMKTLLEYPNSSFTYYLLGKAYSMSGSKKMAMDYLKKAVFHDRENAEARKLLKALSKK
jgi:uncharacterized Ntn-hydrolase superfamily protein